MAKVKVCFDFDTRLNEHKSPQLEQRVHLYTFVDDVMVSKVHSSNKHTWDTAHLDAKKLQDDPTWEAEVKTSTVD